MVVVVVVVVEAVVVVEVVMVVEVDRVVAVVVVIVVGLSEKSAKPEAQTSTQMPIKTLRAIRAEHRQKSQLRFFRVDTCPCRLTG